MNYYDENDMYSKIIELEVRFKELEERLKVLELAQHNIPHRTKDCASPCQLN